MNTLRFANKYLLWLCVLVALALCLRAGRCLTVNRMDKDSIVYIGMAKDWAQKGADYAFTRNSRIPPLYIGMMAFGEKCGLDAEKVGRFVSVVSGALLVIAAGMIGTAVFRRKCLGLTAAFLTAVHPYLIRASEEVMRESLFICLFGFALAFGILGAQKKNLWFWAVAGVFTAFSIMTRSEGMGLLIAAAAWCGWEFVFHKKWTPRNMVVCAMPMAVLCAAFLLFSLPVEYALSDTSSEWTVIDKRVMGYIKRAYEKEEVKKQKEKGEGDTLDNLKNVLSKISIPGKKEEKDLEVFNKGKVESENETDSEVAPKYVQLPPPSNPAVFVSQKAGADSMPAGAAAAENISSEPAKKAEAAPPPAASQSKVKTKIIYLARFLTLEKWIDFTNLFLDAVFPLLVMLVLLVFALTDLRFYRGGAPMRLFLTVFAVEFASRFYVFFSGIPFERRYMISTTFIVAVFAAPGVPRLIAVVRGVCARRKWRVSGRRVTVAVLLIIGLLSAGKGLNPHRDKKWMLEIPRIINVKCPAGKKPIIISDMSDQRIAYYARAEFVKLSTENDDIHYKLCNGKIQQMENDKRVFYGILMQSGSGEHYGTWLALELPFGLQNLAANIRTLGGSNVFIIIEEDDAAFRNRFKQEKTPFPLKLIATFKDRNKTMVNLYQFLSQDEMEKKYGKRL